MLDWDRISELQDEIGPDAFHEVVTLFLDEVEASLDRLRSLTDAPAIESELHFIKGCALNLGFRGLAALTAKGEMEARAGNLSGISHDAVAAIYTESKTSFLATLSDQAASCTGT